MSICMSCGTEHTCEAIRKLLKEWRDDQAQFRAQIARRPVPEAAPGEVRSIVNKILGAEKLTREEWAILSRLPRDEAAPCLDSAGFCLTHKRVHDLEPSVTEAAPMSSDTNLSRIDTSHEAAPGGLSEKPIDALKSLCAEAGGMLLESLKRDNDRLMYENRDAGKMCRGCGQPPLEPHREPCYILDCLKGTCCDTGDLGTKHECQKRPS